MFLYNQYCPVAKAAELLGDRWTILIVRELIHGADSFSTFAKNLPGISRSVLSDRLRRLAAANVIVRSEVEGKKGVRYTLTETGRDLHDVVAAMGTWGARWIMSAPTPEERDPDLIMLYIARHLNEPLLPTERVVVEFLLKTGRSRRRYWLVLAKAGSSLCLQHPGFDTDLWISSKVVDLQMVYMGHSTWTEAVTKELIEVKGPKPLKRQFQDWMLWSAFAPIVAEQQKP